MIETVNLPQPIDTRQATMCRALPHPTPELKRERLFAPPSPWTVERRQSRRRPQWRLRPQLCQYPSRHINDPGYLPPRLVLPSITPVDTMHWMTKPMWSLSIEASGSSQLAAIARGLAKLRYVSTYLRLRGLTMHDLNSYIGRII